MSRHFSQLDILPRAFSTQLRWAGPALAIAAIAAAGAVAYIAKQSSFAAWFLTYALAPERVLPLIGLGIACGLIGPRMFAVALVLFGLGILGGTAAHTWLTLTTYTLLGGTTRLSLTTPVGCLAIGMALIPGARILGYVLPFAAFTEGVMLALAVFLTDPSFHDPLYTWTPVLAAIWIIIAVALTLQAFRGGWSLIFGRIMGSWLVAVGLLYGGASLLPVFKPPPPPEDTSRESTRGAELNQSLRSGTTTEQLERTPPQSESFFGGATQRPPQ